MTAALEAFVVASEHSVNPASNADVARSLLVPLRATLRRVEDVPLSAFEERDDEELRPLVLETRVSLEGGVDIAGRVLSHYESLGEQRDSLRRLVVAEAQPLLGEVERMLDDDVGIRRVQNLAFVARMGLRARIPIFANEQPLPPKWELIDVASSALREVSKALGAIDIAVCKLEGLPEPATIYLTELQRSLEIRRAYRIFHGDVAPDVEPSNGLLGARLRRAANAIAKLSGRSIYPSMRVHDRFMLRSIQRRLQAWLAETDGDATARAAAGFRLHQDVANLAALMMGVNDRAELRQHDAVQVAAALDRIASGEVDAARQLLRAIAGRDLELDEALESGRGASAEGLMSRLHALRSALAPGPRSAPAPRPSAGELSDDDDFF